VAKEQFGDWEPIRNLGRGGQSEVYLARSPLRVAQRKVFLSALSLDELNANSFATASYEYARPERLSELGALKKFNIRVGGAPAEERLKKEIAILRENRANLPRLLAANEVKQWMVTEYFPGGTLEKHPLRYKGKPILALRAFRILVKTVAALHKDGIVHRDIKPANIFIGSYGKLILGDFGIVFVPGTDSRLTITDEQVGPWEHMPPWADIDKRLEDVRPNFDVYMLGRVFCCL